MLRSPFIRTTRPCHVQPPVRCQGHALSMLLTDTQHPSTGLSSSSSSSSASSILVANSTAALPLASWLYRAVLFHRLWREGFIVDALATGSLSAMDFTTLLRNVAQPPSLSLMSSQSPLLHRPSLSVATEDEDSAAVTAVATLQRELTRSLASAMRDSRWPLSPRHSWDCAVALVTARVRPDDALSLALLSPLVHRLVRRNGGRWALQRRLQSLQAGGLHCGVAWLLVRTTQGNTKHALGALSDAATAACSTPASALLTRVGALGSSDPREMRSFDPFWRVLLRAMAVDAQRELANVSASDSTRAAALVSLRRVISSLRHHSRVRPVLELHTIAALAASKGGADFAGPLAYREALLLDAYALMTLGHVGEAATDVDAAAEAATVALQKRCLAHLKALEHSEPTAGVDRDTRGLHRGARAALVRRLVEGVRLALKLLLRRGAHAEIAYLVERCPEVGASWEAGKAFLALHRHSDAITVFVRFLESTRQQFATGLPHHIRTLLLEALEGEAAKTRSVTQLLELYFTTRTWGFSLPPAVSFAAMVRGASNGSDNDTVTHRDHGQKSEEKCMKEKIQKDRLHLVTELLHRRMNSALCRPDGLLLETLEQFLMLLVACGNTNADIKRVSGEGDAFVETALKILPQLQHSYIELPVHRVALQHFLRLKYTTGTDFILRVMTQSPNGTAALQEMPLVALEALAQHVNTSPMDMNLRGAVEKALRQRQVADARPAPWCCRFCRQWNWRRAVSCRCCGAMELAVLRCGTCNGFSPTNETSCRICGATTQKAIPQREHDTESEGETLELVDSCEAYPLRSWQCVRCRYTNDPQHLFYCSRCGAVHPVMASTLAKTVFDCTSCGRRNPFGMLRPWCPSCGTLNRVARDAQPRKSLWRCFECRTMCPWLLTHCHACGGSRPPDDGRYEVPWYAKVCTACSASKPAWATTCHQCGATESVDKRDETKTLLTDAHMEVATCPHCDCVFQSGDVLCTCCFTPRQGSTLRLWVCLHNNCLGVNLDVGDALCCHYCHAVHDHSVMASIGKENLLSYREEPIASLRVVLLPLPQKPRACPACGVFLHLKNIAAVCPMCLHCGCMTTGKEGIVASAALDIAIRSALRTMSQTAQHAMDGHLAIGTAMMLIKTTVAALSVATEERLPWRGCDLSQGMRCGIRPRVPVLQDGVVHSAVGEVADVIRTLCDLAKRAGNSWDDRLPMVRIALDLVDLLNRTTDYDELGFDTLAQLCEVVRPMQRAHIRRETRWAYLKNMKLPREWILNDVLCPKCLQPKSPKLGGAAGCMCRSDSKPIITEK